MLLLLELITVESLTSLLISAMRGSFGLGIVELGNFQMSMNFKALKSFSTVSCSCVSITTILWVCFSPFWEDILQSKLSETSWISLLFPWLDLHHFLSLSVSSQAADPLNSRNSSYVVVTPKWCNLLQSIVYAWWN